MQKLLTWSLQNESVNETQPPDFSMIRGGGIQLEDRFDVVSIQFAIHYMMSTKMRARRFFRTVSQLLDVGGNLIATTIDARVIVSHLMNLGLDLHFDDSKETPNEREPVIRVGGGACRLTFEPHIVKQIFQDHVKDDELPESLFGLEYTFNLVEGSDHGAGVGDAVNLPEWLTPIPVLVALAKEVGLELEYAQNFHEFYAKRSDPSTHASSHSSLYNMKVLNRNGSISGEEWEISRLYMAIKFRKVREPELTPLSDDDDGEEEDDIDAAANQKLMTMALLKAKKAAGNKVWDGLTAEEKTQLTEVERKKLAIARKKKSNSQCGGV
jgi:mRNA (guanine-N7-)-methyltransferase